MWRQKRHLINLLTNLLLLETKVKLEKGELPFFYYNIYLLNYVTTDYSENVGKKMGRGGLLSGQREYSIREDEREKGDAEVETPLQKFHRFLNYSSSFSLFLAPFLAMLLVPLPSSPFLFPFSRLFSLSFISIFSKA
jgi:hypothetical protein